MSASWRWLARVPDPEGMPVYRGLWLTWSLCVGTVASIAAVAAADPVLSSAIFLSCLLVFAVMGVLLVIDLQQPLAAVPGAAVAGAAAMTVLYSLTELVGPWSLVLLGSVVATAPRLVSALIASATRPQHRV